jgi:UDP-N-acetylmuramoyl-tripeptide--D-alanyl-D-alanine ligase
MRPIAGDAFASAAGGRWLAAPPPALRLEGVGTDTRQDLSGRAFVALRGANHDGHDFLGQAAASGAVALVVDRAPPAAAAAPRPALLVDDTRRALLRLAAAHRATLARTTVIAVTGSCGKTTVKALLDAVLSTRLRGRAAPRSFNNDVGLPLALLAADPDDDYLVLEIGANHPGEVGALAEVARPDIGVITMVGRAHLEGFGSAGAVVAEKAALLDHLSGPRLAVVNADAPELRAHVHRAAHCILFGAAPDAEVRLSGRGRNGHGWWFEVGGWCRFALGLPGRHNAVNALAAVAVGRRLGIADDRIGEALARARPVEMRLSRIESGGITVYNDAYNANPDSVLASLDTFAEEASGARRRIVVLGDMLELGAESAELHVEVGRRLAELSRRSALDGVVLVGALAAHAAEPLDRAWRRAHVTLLASPDPPSAAALAGGLEPGDAVLLKASRAVGLERIQQAIESRSA